MNAKVGRNGNPCLKRHRDGDGRDGGDDRGGHGRATVSSPTSLGRQYCGKTRKSKVSWVKLFASTRANSP